MFPESRRVIGVRVPKQAQGERLARCACFFITSLLTLTKKRGRCFGVYSLWLQENKWNGYVGCSHLISFSAG